jgi:hypothetical protein
MACFGDSISDIIGPVTPINSGPWSAYDLTVKAEIDLLEPAAMAYVPLAGSALPGTYTINHVSPITLTGTMAPGVSMGDQILVAWNGPDGAANTRLLMTVASVAGNVITTTNNSGLSDTVWNSSPLSGLTVYACSRCTVDIVDPMYGSGILVYSCPYWGICGQNGTAGWNYYDSSLAMYRTYLRTGNSTYLTYFRNFTDTWWEWAVQSGAYLGLNPPRWFSLVSQFVRALDIGGSQGTARLAAIYQNIFDNYTFNVGARLDGQDDREPGYTLIWTAVGARADPDPTRHASYCTMNTSLVNNAISVLSTSGLPYWPEKGNAFPYAMPGVSPWRLFSMTQGLARSYDVLIDTSSAGCNNPTLAASALTAIQGAAAFIYTSGYDSVNRDVFYDVQYPNDGRDFVTVSHQGSGCVVTSGSASVSCPSAQLQTDFVVGNFAGFETAGGQSWTGKIATLPTQTSMTLTANWNGPMQTSTAYTGNFSAGSYTAIPTDVGLTKSVAASTSCNSSASFCTGFGASQQMGFQDRSGNFDAIWIMGWLFKTTGATIWKTRGDDLFSAAYGGPITGSMITPGPCGGPGCDGYMSGYTNQLTGCGSNSNVPPCNPFNNQPANINAYSFQGRSLGQMDGIGGADNYLAWRLGITPPTPATPNITGSVSLGQTLTVTAH